MRLTQYFQIGVGAPNESLQPPACPSWLNPDPQDLLPCPHLDFANDSPTPRNEPLGMKQRSTPAHTPEHPTPLNHPLLSREHSRDIVLGLAEPFPEKLRPLPVHLGNDLPPYKALFPIFLPGLPLADDRFQSPQPLPSQSLEIPHFHPPLTSPLDTPHLVELLPPLPSKSCPRNLQPIQWPPPHPLRLLPSLPRFALPPAKKEWTARSDLGTPDTFHGIDQ